MQVKILADENVDFRIIQKLRESGFTVQSVLEDFRSYGDFEILQIAKKSNSILLTLDKDFGEWVFAHKEDPIGIVLLRYHPKEFQEITNTLFKFLDQHGAKLYGKFAVLTVSKVRVREIHL
ncbi:DUF5615 family PIN-like protein [Leptospira alstonii]|uniref:DUF5615 domain-containing protein n=2 Tax=Leptospira alstonii TaxID=28452 RepID=M6CG97_9LEPT|nr:DUF5615 family PIN-like protein [Leptospira alstonii]EMJ90892.1 hypothetical protein LEP1GSC194_1265 [Leptospira alstonii serovar Sichuan str. 79601]EQA78617.1 hypothetical protein LEP1GSC193_0082 [Leptospira alstonii serovar Pingchang str. 80-412]